MVLDVIETRGHAYRKRFAVGNLPGNMGRDSQRLDSVVHHHAGETTKIATALEGIGHILRTAHVGRVAPVAKPLLSQPIPPVHPAWKRMRRVATVHEHPTRKIAQCMENLR